MSITYKQLKTIEDLFPFEKLQMDVWGFIQRDIIPARFIRVLCKHGGFAMGAFDGNVMVGFVFGVPAIHYGRPSQHSHMLAVLPEYRDQNVGFKLKEAQRKDAIERNLDLVTWTFDPLQSKNAHLNLNKLGVIACSYEINFYGEESSSDLHSALGTDRILAEWWLHSDKVKSIMDGSLPVPASPAGRRQAGTQKEIKEFLSGGMKVNMTERDEQGLLIPSELDLTALEDVLLLEIPDNIDETKMSNLPLARLWREHIQKALLHYFSAGYYINSLQIERKGNMRRIFYVLERLDGPYKSMTLY